MYSLRLLQRTLSSASLLTVSCCRSKLISLNQIPSSNCIGQSYKLSSCAKILDTRTPKEDSSDSAHEKSLDSSLVTTTYARNKDNEKLKEALERLRRNENGFEVIDVPGKENTFLLKKQAAGETIQILVNRPHRHNRLTVNVGKVDGTCLEFFCYIDGRPKNRIWIKSMLIKEKGHSSNLEDYDHYKHSAFKLTDDERDYWLYDRDSFRIFDELFGEFLEARGINNRMAEWIENYMQNKPEMEKSIWLENVKHIIDK